MHGLDYSYSRPGESAIKAAGYGFVCRYLSHTPGKNISSKEVADIKNSGLKLVLVWESTGQRPLDGFSAGQQDARDGQKLASSCGCGEIPAIYFAVDFDASTADQVKINEYLRGCADILGLSRVGVYGGCRVVQRAFDANRITWGWQTYAWSSGKWEPRAQLRQIKNSQTLNGASVDINESITDNFGQWPVTTMDNSIDTVVANKVNEFQRENEATAYQIFAIPSENFFTNILKDKWENVRKIPADWPIDPKDWAGQREYLRNDLTAAQDRIKDLEAQIVNIPVPAPVDPDLGVIKAFVKLISKWFKE